MFVVLGRPLLDTVGEAPIGLADEGGVARAELLQGVECKVKIKAEDPAGLAERITGKATRDTAESFVEGLFAHGAG